LLQPVTLPAPPTRVLHLPLSRHELGVLLKLVSVLWMLVVVVMVLMLV
jgi:hypothetical protein